MQSKGATRYKKRGSVCAQYKALKRPWQKYKMGVGHPYQQLQESPQPVRNVTAGLSGQHTISDIPDKDSCRPLEPISLGTNTEVQQEPKAPRVHNVGTCRQPRTATSNYLQLAVVCLFCNLPLGILALCLALCARSTKSRSQARDLAESSWHVSVAGIVLTVGLLCVLLFYQIANKWGRIFVDQHER